MDDAQFLADLYEIIKQNKREDYDRIITEKASYPYLYHLSEIRQNLVDWLSIEAGDRVLECNPECGALTGKLLAKASEVICIAENRACADIIRARCPAEATNGGRLRVVQKDDWERQAGIARCTVILIAGDFYRYIGRLPALRGMLEEGGRLIVADANRLGLRYLAGAQEEYSGGYFVGIEGYPGGGDCLGQARCYTRGEYVKILLEAGFKKARFYYPYPDHKFPSCVYSDDWLPKRGELSENRRNFQRDRMQLFDERRVYDTLLGEGLFGAFSNSFLIEAMQ